MEQQDLLISQVSKQPGEYSVQTTLRGRAVNKGIKISLLVYH